MSTQPGSPEPETPDAESPESENAVYRQDSALDADPAFALAGVIDAPLPLPPTYLPPMWHLIYFLDRPAHRDLGPEGHPVFGRPTPPAPGLRRMFAGGRVEHLGLLEFGVPATMRQEVTSTVQKQGRSGALWFVTVTSTYTQGGQGVIVDERDIVYRPATESADASRAGDQPRAASSGRATEGPDDDPRHQLTLAVDERLLFQFSALTYNAHRIHYDIGWAAHEGYAGLVVHGPLQALMMAELARRSGTDLVGTRFSYRLVSPFVGTGELRVVEPTPGVFEVRDPSGVATARATLETN